MAFHEVQFPTSVAYGSRGGPGFSTSIVEGDGGSSERISRWANAKRHYNVSPGIKSLAALSAVLDFYIARQGPAIGFRFKDLMDFTTAANHRDAPSSTDVLLGTASGTSGQFQLRTKYVSGPTTVYRNIRKPVLDTTLIGCNGSTIATSNYTVDTTTGLVTVTGGLTNGQSVTGGCEFDVPVQFASELDTNFDVSQESYNRGNIPDIMLVEMVGDVSSPERFYAGGSSVISTTGTLALSFAYGRVLIYVGNGAGTWLLPDPTDLELGGPYFIIYNFGSTTPTLTLKTADNLTTLPTTITAGKLGMLCVYNDGTANKWALIVTT